MSIHVWFLILIKILCQDKSCNSRKRKFYCYRKIIIKSILSITYFTFISTLFFRLNCIMRSSFPRRRLVNNENKLFCRLYSNSLLKSSLILYHWSQDKLLRSTKFFWVRFLLSRVIFLIKSCHDWAMCLSKCRIHKLWMEILCTILSAVQDAHIYFRTSEKTFLLYSIHLFSLQILSIWLTIHEKNI